MEEKMSKESEACNLIFNTQYFVDHPKTSPALKSYFPAM